MSPTHVTVAPWRDAPRRSPFLWDLPREVQRRPRPRRGPGAAGEAAGGGVGRDVGPLDELQEVLLQRALVA